MAPACGTSMSPSSSIPDSSPANNRPYSATMPLVACLSSELPEAGQLSAPSTMPACRCCCRAARTARCALSSMSAPIAARAWCASLAARPAALPAASTAGPSTPAARRSAFPRKSISAVRSTANKHLVECPAEERHGLVFVLPTPAATMDLDAHLGELDRDLAAIGLDTAEVVHADVLPVPATGNMALDTFFETYHLNSLHRETFKGLFSPICVFDTFGPHHRYTFAPLTSPTGSTCPRGLAGRSDPAAIFPVPQHDLVGRLHQQHRLDGQHPPDFPAAVDHFTSRLSYLRDGRRAFGRTPRRDRPRLSTARQALVNEDYSVAGESHGGLPALPQGMTLPIGRQEIGVQNFHRNVAAPGAAEQTSWR